MKRKIKRWWKIRRKKKNSTMTVFTLLLLLLVVFTTILSGSSFFIHPCHYHRQNHHHQPPQFDTIISTTFTIISTCTCTRTCTPTTTSTRLSKNQNQCDFSTAATSSSFPSKVVLYSNNNSKNWLFELWDEVIEFSTYGPGERKMLKQQREAAKAAAAAQAAAEAANNNNGIDVDDDNNDVSLQSFQKAVAAASVSTKSSSSSTTTTKTTKKTATPGTNENKNTNDNDDSLISLQAFQSAVAETQQKNDDTSSSFDGYQLRDLLIEKWGVPLDIDFQRGGLGGGVGGLGLFRRNNNNDDKDDDDSSAFVVYCTILPVVGYGSSMKSRHASELDYLMHLQGVIEVLQKYNNLDAFLVFLQTTNKVPKPGIESVPYRMELSKDDLKQILNLK